MARDRSGDKGNASGGSRGHRDPETPTNNKSEFELPEYP